MQLSKRLECIFQMIEPCQCLCDIGTDHAHIPIAAIQNGVVQKAIASDVRKGPCDVARKNIAAHGLAQQIEVRMGSGFQTVKPGECDCAVIAGMGGHLMLDLFGEATETLKQCKQLVVQPQNALERIRAFFYEEGYAIQSEKLVYDEGKFYTVFSVAYTGKKVEKERIDTYIGEGLLRGPDPLLEAYLEKEIQRLQRILAQTEQEEVVWLLQQDQEIKENLKK